MGFTKLVYDKSWNNPLDFPTVEDSEEKVRQDLEYLPEAARVGLNRLIDELEAAEAAGKLGFDATETIPKNNIQEAIEYLHTLFSDLDASDIAYSGSEVSASTVAEAIAALKGLFNGIAADTVSFDSSTEIPKDNVQDAIEYLSQHFGGVTAADLGFNSSTTVPQANVQAAIEALISSLSSLSSTVDGKQSKITANGVLQGNGSGGVTVKAVDATVTSGSSNLVTSGAVYTAINTAIANAIGGDY